jgi:hypothetical protein
MKTKAQIIHQRASQRRIIREQPTNIFHQIKHHCNHTENPDHEEKRGQELSDDVPINSLEGRLVTHIVTTVDSIEGQQNLSKQQNHPQ